MPRVNIVIQSDLLEEIDRAATQNNLSRSGLLQEAARAYLDRRRQEREAAERKMRMEKAAAEMDRLAEKFGKWDGVKIIRHFRDSRSGLKA
jgi:metal-responsive CopG/Arc/MetJ family transcriptional regulator